MKWDDIQAYQLPIKLPTLHKVVLRLVCIPLTLLLAVQIAMVFYDLMLGRILAYCPHVNLNNLSNCNLSSVPNLNLLLIGAALLLLAAPIWAWRMVKPIPLACLLLLITEVLWAAAIGLGALNSLIPDSTEQQGHLIFAGILILASLALYYFSEILLHPPDWMDVDAFENL